MKLSEILTEMQTGRYEMCLVWQTEKDAEEIKNACNTKYGTNLEVEDRVMFFPDKMEYDYVLYHYFMKIPPDRRPERKEVSKLTEAELTHFGPKDPVRQAKKQISILAQELKVSSNDLIMRYERRLKTTSNNAQRALSQLELSMNLPKGRLKGFDSLYLQATAK